MDVGDGGGKRLSIAQVGTAVRADQTLLAPDDVVGSGSSVFLPNVQTRRITTHESKMLSRNVALARARSLPDFKEDADGDGYSFRTVHGQRIGIRGAGIVDEVFHSEIYGPLNVSKAVHGIASELHADDQPTRLPIDDALRDHIAKREVDIEVVRRMPKRRWKEPILAAMTPKGLFIIDGNHRLARLIMDGHTYANAWILQPEVLDRIRVQWFAENEAGAMEEVSHRELTRRFLKHPTM